MHYTVKTGNGKDEHVIFRFNADDDDEAVIETARLLEIRKKDSNLNPKRRRHKKIFQVKRKIISLHEEVSLWQGSRLVFPKAKARTVTPNKKGNTRKRDHRRFLPMTTQMAA